MSRRPFRRIPTGLPTKGDDMALQRRPNRAHPLSPRHGPATGPWHGSAGPPAPSASPPSPLAVGLGILVASDTTAHSSVHDRVPTATAFGSTTTDHIGRSRTPRPSNSSSATLPPRRPRPPQPRRPPMPSPPRCRASHERHRAGDGASLLGCGDQHIAARSMRAIGTTATVAVTAADRADEALALLADDLRALDAACSRFRPDSELRRLEVSSGGRPVAVSPLLFDALEVALRGRRADGRHRRPDHRVGPHRARLRPRLRRDRRRRPSRRRSRRTGPGLVADRAGPR